MLLSILGQQATLREEGEKIYIEVMPTGLIQSEFGEMESGKHLGNRLFSVKNSPRNWFTLDVLSKGALNGWSNRYLKGVKLQIPYKPVRDLEWAKKHNRIGPNGYEHVQQRQIIMVNFHATRLQCINGGEMGIGKTLGLFETIDYFRNVMGLREGVLWWCAPKSALTSFATQCEKWQFYLRGNDRVFNYHGLEREMENATDWPQHLILDESTAVKIPSSRRTQLAIQLAIEMDRRWKDRCSRLLCSGSPQPESYFDWWSQCEIARPGWLRESTRPKFERRLAVFTFMDKPGGGVYPEFASWKQAEVELLPKRLDGLVLPMWKKDWLDLPEKIYEVITLHPSVATLRVARHLAKTVAKAKLNQKLRQLSDGFQYVDVSSEEDSEEEVDNTAQDVATGRAILGDTPKDQLLRDLLDKYSNAKRFVVYGAYQATVDRCARIAAEEGWRVWQYDGRGSIGGITEDQFNAHQSDSTKICFVGNPDSAGMGLTLSGSPAIFYYSNSFKGQSRTQSEDRIHRPGATRARGCTIIDCVHLPTDARVIDAVKQKRNVERAQLEEVLALLGDGSTDVR